MLNQSKSAHRATPIPGFLTTRRQQLCNERAAAIEARNLLRGQLPIRCLDEDPRILDADVAVDLAELELQEIDEVLQALQYPGQQL